MHIALESDENTLQLMGVSCGLTKSLPHLYSMVMSPIVMHMVLALLKKYYRILNPVFMQDLSNDVLHPHVRQSMSVSAFENSMQHLMYL